MTWDLWPVWIVFGLPLAFLTVKDICHGDPLSRQYVSWLLFLALCVSLSWLHDERESMYAQARSEARKATIAQWEAIWVQVGPKIERVTPIAERLKWTRKRWGR